MEPIKNTQLDGDVSVGRDAFIGGGLITQGGGRIKGGLKVDGWLDAPNITGPSKGLYATVEDLEASCPKPLAGWWALVGNALPADIYVVSEGAWVAAGTKGGEPVLHGEEVEKLVKAVAEDAAAVARQAAANANAVAERVDRKLSEESYEQMAGYDAEKAMSQKAVTEFVGFSSFGKAVSLTPSFPKSGLKTNYYKDAYQFTEKFTIPLAANNVYEVSYMPSFDLKTKGVYFSVTGVNGEDEKKLKDVYAPATKEVTVKLTPESSYESVKIYMALPTDYATNDYSAELTVRCVSTIGRLEKDLNTIEDRVTVMEETYVGKSNDFSRAIPKSGLSLNYYKDAYKYDIYAKLSLHKGDRVHIITNPSFDPVGQNPGHVNLYRGSETFLDVNKYKNKYDIEITADGDYEGVHFYLAVPLDYATMDYTCDISVEVVTVVARVADVEQRVSDLETKDTAVATDIISLNPQAEERFNAISRHYYYQTNDKGHPLVLAHFSDVHGDSTRLARVMQFCDKYDGYIDDILHTGDTVRQVPTDGIGFWNDNNAGKVLNVVGNHDVGYFGPNPRSITTKECYDLFFAPYISRWGVVQPDNAAADGLCYYYKDYGEQKIRLITLDGTAFDSAQRAWFEEVLEGARTEGYSVVVANHYPYADGTFDAHLGTGFTSYPTHGGMMPDGIPAAVDTFTHNGGSFICHLTGHVHLSGCVFSHKTYPGQLCIAAPSAAGINAYNSFTRTGKSVDSFTIIAFDTYLKEIKMFSVGNDMDLNMRRRDTYCHNYATHEDIVATV